MAGPLDSGQSPAGGLDSWVRRYDPDGEPAWTDQYGSSAHDVASGIVAHDGGVVTVGRGGDVADDTAGSLDVFVRRYHPDGDVDWTRQLGTADVDLAFHNPVATDGSAIYIAGQTLGSFTDPTETDFDGAAPFVAKLDRVGNTVWVEQFDSRGAVSLLGGIAADSDGVVVVSSRAGAGSIRQFAPDGTLQWEHAGIGGVGNCAATYWDVAVHDGMAYATGQWAYTFATDPDSCNPSGFTTVVGVLHAYDRDDGNGQWERILKGGTRDGNEEFTGAKWVDASDAGIYVGANLTTSFPGHVPDPTPDRRDCPGLTTGNAFVDKLDAYVRHYSLDGDVVWTRQFGGAAFDLAQGLAPIGDDVVIVGDTSCRLDTNQTYAGGSRDAFLVQLAQQPESLPGQIHLIVGDLETLSDAGVLDAGTFDGLVQQLEAAQRDLSNDNPSAAHNSLTAFIDHVHALQTRGSLTDQHADQLADAAEQVLEQL